MTGVRYVNVLSNRQQVGTNFTGSITFNHKLQSNQEIPDLRNAYVQLGVTMNNASGDLDFVGGNFVPGNQSISQNVASCLFSYSELKINDIIASRAENHGVHLTHHKLLNESFEYQKESGSPYLPYEGETSYRRVDGLITALGNGDALALKTTSELDYFANQRELLSNVVEFTAGGTRFDKTMIAITAGYTMTVTFPLCQMETNEETDNEIRLLGNTSLMYTLQVNPQFASLFYSNSATPATTVAHFDFTTVELVLPIVETTRIPHGITHKLTYQDARHVRINNQFLTHTFQVESSAKLLVVTFQQQVNQPNVQYAGGLVFTPGAGGVPLLSYYDSNIPIFPSSNVAGDANALISLYVNAMGKTHPSNPYNLAKAGTNSWRRAYEDYKRLSKSMQHGEHNLIKSFASFVRAPVFVFDISGVENTSDQQSITVHQQYIGSPVATLTDICVSYYFDKMLEVQYDSSGVPSTTVSLV